MFSNLKKDLATYGGNWLAQGFWVMVVYRFGRWRYGIRWGLFRKPLSLFYRLCLKTVQIVTGVDLPCEAEVGDYTRIDHFGGVIVSGYAKLGAHCVLRNGVTIGLKNAQEPCAPQIGDHVDIGAGAKILGKITIGNNVMIGANAVVLIDVPSNSVAVGVPARILPKKTPPVDNISCPQGAPS